jgi:hypothetical protein
MNLSSFTTPSALVGAILALGVVGAATAALCTGNLTSGDWLATVTAATTGTAGIVGAHVGASAALAPPPGSQPSSVTAAPVAPVLSVPAVDATAQTPTAVV